MSCRSDFNYQAGIVRCGVWREEPMLELEVDGNGDSALVVVMRRMMNLWMDEWMDEWMDGLMDG